MTQQLDGADLKNGNGDTPKSVDKRRKAERAQSANERKMLRTELLRAISVDANQPVTTVTRVIDAAVNVIIKAARENRPVHIEGLGTFSPYTTEPRKKGVDSKTRVAFKMDPKSLRALN